jgi:hypothetical protein
MVAIFGIALPGVGIPIFATVPATDVQRNTQIPCIGQHCFACLAPSRAECIKLASCGGDLCHEEKPESLTPDGYAGLAGRLARGLREAQRRDALIAWHTEFDVADGGVSDCSVTVVLDREQRAAWIRTVDAAGAGSDVVDCRSANLPAKWLRGGSRRHVFAGAMVGSDSFPEDAIDPVDGGPE